MNRRAFLKYCGALGASALMGEALGLAQELRWGQKRDFPMGMLLIDAHAHPDIFPCTNTFCDQRSTLEKIKQLRMNASVFAEIGDRSNETAVPFETLLARLDTILEWEDQGQIQLIRRCSDLPHDVLSPHYTPGALLAVEGGTPLEDKVDRVDTLYGYGVRLVTLMHYMVNEIGDIMTKLPQHNGLTDVGRKIVERMMALGMIVDVAHAHFSTLEDVAEIARSHGIPIIDSHTSLNPNSDDLSRRRTWDEMEMVAETGGLICTWPVRYDLYRIDICDWAEENLLIAQRLGIEHVALGTDGGGIGNLAPIVAEYESILDLPKLAKAMEEVGFKRSAIEAYMGKNFYRVMKKCLR